MTRLAHSAPSPSRDVSLLSPSLTMLKVTPWECVTFLVASANPQRGAYNPPNSQERRRRLRGVSASSPLVPAKVGHVPWDIGSHGPRECLSDGGIGVATNGGSPSGGLRGALSSEGEASRKRSCTVCERRDASPRKGPRSGSGRVPTPALVYGEEWDAAPQTTGD